MRVTRHEKAVYLKLTHKRQQEAGAESVYDCLVGFFIVYQSRLPRQQQDATHYFLFFRLFDYKLIHGETKRCRHEEAS